MQITAIIPTYNYGQFVSRAIQSTLDQTYPLTEILVIDDGSTDNTQEIVSAFPAPVRYVYQENRGLSGARNTGMREAKTEWVAFLDSDDWWLPQKIEKQVESLRKNPGAVLSYTGVYLVSPDGTKREVQAFSPENLWPNLRHTNRIVPSTVMGKKELFQQVGGFNEKLKACEDWEMWVKIGPSYQFTSVTEPMLMYQLTPMSMSTNIDRMMNNMELILEPTLLSGLSGVSRWAWRKRIRSAELFRSFKSAREANSAGTSNYLLKSIWEWPTPFFIPDRFVALMLQMLK